MIMKTKFKLLLLTILFFKTIFGQQFYGGEIRVVQLATYTVNAEVNLYTSVHDDLETIELCWGDGFCDDIPLVQEITYAERGLKHHRFSMNHTYGSEAMYNLRIEDCCWNQEIRNITIADSQAFVLQTDYFLSVEDPTFGENQMPIFTPGLLYVPNFNLLNYDANVNDSEGDEIEVELCTVDNIITYFQPSDVLFGPTNNLWVDSLDGSFQWLTPQSEGHYVLALCVTERRNDQIISEQNRYLSIFVDTPVSNEELNQESVRIYPNPAQDFLNIELPTGVENPEIAIYNSLGQSMTVNYQDEKLLLRGLHTGLHYVRLRAGDWEYVGRFLVISK